MSNLISIKSSDFFTNDYYHPRSFRICYFIFFSHDHQIRQKHDNTEIPTNQMRRNGVDFDKNINNNCRGNQRVILSTNS